MAVHVGEGLKLLYCSPEWRELAVGLSARYSLKVDVVAKGGERICYQGMEFPLDRGVEALIIDSPSGIRRAFVENVDRIYFDTVQKASER